MTSQTALGLRVTMNWQDFTRIPISADSACHAYCYGHQSFEAGGASERRVVRGG